MIRPATWKLKQWRRERGLTQAQAGDLVGVTKRTWLVWEKGQDRPNETAMIRLYAASDGWITPNDFYPLPALDRRLKVAA